MKRGPIKNGPPMGDHMGFDLNGRPLPMGPEEVRALVTRALVTRALDDPASEVVALVLRCKGDLILHVNGAPDRETLTALRQVLQQLVDGYAHILKGQ